VLLNERHKALGDKIKFYLIHNIGSYTENAQVNVPSKRASFPK